MSIIPQQFCYSKTFCNIFIDCLCVEFLKFYCLQIWEDVMNKFYSLHLNKSKERKESYSLEIFSYNGTYTDLISAVREDTIYDMADDSEFSFYEFCTGDLFVETLNWSAVRLGKDFDVEQLFEVQIKSIEESERYFKKALLTYSFLTACIDKNSMELMDKVKELEKNKIISCNSINSKMKSLGIAYNVCVTYSEDNTPTYYFENMSDVIHFDLCQFLKNNIDIKKCENCGDYFIPKTRSDEIYCDSMDKDGKPCRQKGYENKVNNDAILKEYRKIYKTQNARKQRNKHKANIEELFKKWHINAKSFLIKCQNNEINIADMVKEISGTEWMKGE